MNKPVSHFGQTGIMMAQFAVFIATESTTEPASVHLQFGRLFVIISAP
jgi:hypothetical protein